MTMWTVDDLSDEEALRRQFIALVLNLIMSFTHKL